MSSRSLPSAATPSVTPGLGGAGAVCAPAGPAPSATAAPTPVSTASARIGFACLSRQPTRPALGHRVAGARSALCGDLILVSPKCSVAAAGRLSRRRGRRSICLTVVGPEVVLLKRDGLAAALPERVLARVVVHADRIDGGACVLGRLDPDAAVQRHACARRDELADDDVLL